MNHLALFNGIGGFQLAADWCGWNNIAHVEIDDFCNKVVARHFPNSVCHKDIKDFDGKQYAGTVDIISGGFPCQPYSVAGKRLGKEDDRALWPEMRRVITEVRPTWVIGENVAGIISMGIEHYLTDLEEAGYNTQAFIIPACSVGAIHRRDRVWIVAYSERNKQSWEKPCCRETRRMGRKFKPFPWNRDWESALREFRGVDDGVSYGVDRIDTLRNTIVPQVAFVIFNAINTIENERQIHQ